MLALILSLTLSTLIAPFIIFLYKKKNWVDNPLQKHVKKIHTTPLPRGGGLVVAVSIIISSALLLEWDPYLLSILGGVAVLAAVGWADDVFDIHPLWRLTANLLAAVLVVTSGLGIWFVSNPFGEGVISLAYGWLPQVLAVLFLVWNMNIINWASGVDGQLAGFTVAASLVIGWLSLQFLSDPSTLNSYQLSLIVAGAFLGLLIWNWFPQKMITGYGAGSIAGFMMATLAILSGAKVATTLMVLAIPTADAMFTIARRIRAGKQPWWGDRGHLHHKLIDVWGWNQEQVAIAYVVTSLSLGLLSLFFSTWGKIILITFSFVVVWLVLIVSKIKSQRMA